MTTQVATLSNDQKKQQCLKESELFQKKFPDVPSVSFEEIISSWDPDSYLFVDTRTASEQKVSVIPGSIPLRRFRPSQAEGTDGTPKKVVCYCTVGYRSGLEATRLHHKYPYLNVWNANGILAYTHTEGAPPLTKLDGTETRRVHCFASDWDFAHDSYTTVTFSFSSRIFRYLQVGWLAFVRKLQSAFRFTRNGCKEV